MSHMNRRTAMVLGLTAAVGPAALSQAKAAMYGSDEGEPLTGEGVKEVRRVSLSQRETMIPGYKEVVLYDLVFQPEATFPETEMPAAMVCQLLEGELEIINDGQRFTAKKNDVWTCHEGGTEGANNKASEAAVMRVARLNK